MLHISKAGHKAFDVLGKIIADLQIQLLLKLLKLLEEQCRLRLGEDHLLVNELRLFLLIGYLTHDGKSSTPSPHIIKPGNKATRKQHPIAAGFDGSVDRRVSGIGYGKGHAGYGEHSVYCAVSERNDGFPVDFMDIAPVLNVVSGQFLQQPAQKEKRPHDTFVDDHRNGLLSNLHGNAHFGAKVKFKRNQIAV